MVKYISNKKAPWATAVVNSHDKIIYVGNDEGALNYIGLNSKIINLEERLVLSGLTDAHTHSGMVAASYDFLSMDIVTDRKALMSNVTNMIETNPKRYFILGGYWDNSSFGAAIVTKYMP